MTGKASVEKSIPNFLNLPRAVVVLWVMALLAVPVWAMNDSFAWDFVVYGKALHSLQSGHDPYSDAMAVQEQHHQQVLAHGGVDTDTAPPYSYVYSPITLPFLSMLGHIPLPLLTGLYWLIYSAGVLAALVVGFRLGEPSESHALLYFAGVAAFFPGLLANGVLLSGNVGYIAYGAMLLLAFFGWKRGIWLPFYIAVVIISCAKAPLLSFALLPALSARRQWWPAAIAIATGLCLFAVQPLIWPSLFRHYVRAVELQFSYNHDFGCSPAGLFSRLLSAEGIPYDPFGYIFYAAYALPLFLALVYFSRRYLKGDFTLEQWAPVLLLGTVLLNPRIQEYDVAPITLPLALIAWRFARTRLHPGRWIAGMLALFVLLNSGALYNWELRKALDGPLLVIILLAGFWCLLQQVRGARSQSHRRDLESGYPGRRRAEHAVSFGVSRSLRRSA